MEYKKLLAALHKQKMALLDEEKFTAKRMFEAADVKETLILLGKIEELQKRQDVLQNRVGTIVAWNKQLSDDKKLKRSSK